MAFTETFTASDGPLTTADQVWTKTSGGTGLAIVSNTLQAENDAIGHYRCETALSSIHHRVECDVHCSFSGGNPAYGGVKIRYDPTTGIAYNGHINITADSWVLDRNGITLLSGSVALDLGVTYRLGLQISGEQLTFDIDGVVLGSVIDGGIESGVRVGVFAYKPNAGPVILDNLSAIELPDPPPPPDATEAARLTIFHSVLHGNHLHSPFKYWQDTDPILEVGNTVAPKDAWSHEAAQFIKVRNAANTAWINVK